MTPASVEAGARSRVLMQQQREAATTSGGVMVTSRGSESATGTPALFSGPSFPEMYEAELVGPLFAPWAEPILDELGLSPGDRVLDVACGTGIVARRAQERLRGTGAVVGVDVNPQMLAVARRVAPALDWREGDASALPLHEGEEFDVVVCQQGLQFFQDRASAVRQMRRALSAGGRVGLSTWRPDEEFPVLRQLRAVAERRVGPIADRRHGIGEAGPVEALLRDAGFRDIRSRRYARTITFADGFTFVRLNAMALVGMSTGAKELGDEERQRVVAAIVEDSADLVRLHTHEAGFAYEIGTNLILARA